MIIDLERFTATEKPFWDELERLLKRVEDDPACRLGVEGAARFHYLYQRASAGLARLDGLAAPLEFRRYLESLVARAYGEIHSTRDNAHRLVPRTWLLETFPQTFRRYIRQFQLAVLITIVGAIFGAAVLMVAPEEKGMLLPFDHLHGSPAERVAKEEQEAGKRLAGHKATFSSSLMTHNTQVSIACMATGMTWGVGTIILLFYNGVILGAVVLDYLAAGQGVFLAGWLLPHGVIEIPAILIAGQAGLVLATTLIGKGSGLTLVARMRKVWADLTTLIGGVGLMLIWAGIVEAFFSQYHEPVLPYSVKIAFGVVELCLLVLFLGRSGRGGKVTNRG
jgi:uncharacterized membrane protein SpoIIM required for sporulation